LAPAVHPEGRAQPARERLDLQGALLIASGMSLRHTPLLLDKGTSDFVRPDAAARSRTEQRRGFSPWL